MPRAAPILPESMTARNNFRARRRSDLSGTNVAGSGRSGNLTSDDRHVPATPDPRWEVVIYRASSAISISWSSMITEASGCRRLVPSHVS
jgi:hypothetical protein